MALAQFMATPIGRGVRAIAGIVLIIIGISMGSAAGWIVAAIGLVPLAAGVANVCLIAPVIGAPFKGSEASR